MEAAVNGHSPPSFLLIQGMPWFCESMHLSVSTANDDRRRIDNRSAPSGISPPRAMLAEATHKTLFLLSSPPPSYYHQLLAFSSPIVFFALFPIILSSPCSFAATFEFVATTVSQLCNVLLSIPYYYPCYYPYQN
jgi:hypothetical protein